MYLKTSEHRNITTQPKNLSHATDKPSTTVGCLIHCSVSRRRNVSMRVERLTDKATIRTFLTQDRARYAYMLGDLAEPYWPHAAFYGAFAGEGLPSLRAVVLKYLPIFPHPVITAGEPEAVAEVVRVLAEDEQLSTILYHAQPEHMPIVDRKSTR